MELATKLWGDAPGDRYILAIWRNKKKASDFQFKTTQEALDFAVKMNQDEKCCVMFSQALFVADTSREQQNALTVRSFWLDLDVQPDPEKNKKGQYYNSQDEAKLALAQFINSMNLPVPTLVSSGVGVQAHWILSERIEPERWQKSADAFKQAAKKLGLKQDRTRTADISSVMRLPDTLHLKDLNNPKPVEVFGSIQPDMEIEDFERAVAPYITVTAISIRNKVFGANYPKRPNDANKVADACGVVAAVRDSKGCVPEPVWMHTLQLLNHCTDGELYAQEWSSAHHEYSEEATQRKFDDKSHLGPTNCSTFEEVWIGDDCPCKVCPHRGKITSPIQKGVTMTPAFALAPVVELGPAVGKSTDDLSSWIQKEPTEPVDDNAYVPQGYTVGREGVWYHDEESEKDKPILKNVPLVLEKKDKSVHGGSTQATFKWQKPTGTIDRGTILVKDLADLKTVAQWLLDNDITGFHVRNVELVRDYMQACIDLYGQKTDPGLFHEHMGWTPKEHPQQGFVLGQKLITSSGISEAKLNERRIPPTIVKGFGEKGTLEGWAAATEYISDERYMPHQFTLLMMIASPLFELVGFQGSVVSLVGKTGLGKSTSAYMGMSFFGVDIGSKKSKALEIGAGSTEKSFRERWVLAHNLPVLIDEAHTIKANKVDIGQLVYDAVNGTMRDVLNRSSTLRASDNFNLMTILGCNSPMLDHPVSVIPDAARKRMFEFNLGKEHEIGKQDAIRIYSILEDNYGVAGRTYLEEVLRLKEYIESQKHAIKQSYADSPLASDYRFNLWNVGVGRLAGEICERLGIIRFDYRKPIAWAARSIEQTAGQATTPVQIISDLLAEYERLHQGRFTVTRDDNWFASTVLGECFGRYQRDKQHVWTLAIPKKLFTTFVRENGADKHALAQWEKDNNVSSTNVKLTNIMGTTWCYVIPISGANVPAE
jgi:hypothetical protein